MALKPHAVRAATLRVTRRAGIFTLLRRPRALWRFFKAPDAPKASKVIAVLALFYVVFPLDLIPDVIPLLGWIDDLGIAAVALSFVASQASRYGELRPSTPAVVVARRPLSAA